jgi:hypothetical protein
MSVFEFTYIDADGKEKSQCLLFMKILVVDSVKPNTLKRNLETVHTECV